MGNRVSKIVYDITNPLSPVMVSHRKFIVDINSQLPVVLCEIEADPQSQDYGSLKKSYFYADAQPLCQYKHTVDELQQPVADVSFYVHDRLGSVRLPLGTRASRPLFCPTPVPAWAASGWWSCRAMTSRRVRGPSVSSTPIPTPRSAASTTAKSRWDQTTIPSNSPASGTMTKLTSTISAPACTTPP